MSLETALWILVVFNTLSNVALCFYLVFHTNLAFRQDRARAEIDRRILDAVSGDRRESVLTRNRMSG